MTEISISSDEGQLLREQGWVNCVLCMKELNTTTFENSSLEEIAKELSSRYYETICCFCNEASEIALQLRAKEIDNTAPTEIYTVLCMNFTRQLRRFQEQRIDTLVPYVISLAEKQQNGHNCNNCTNGCQVNHVAQLALLQESHQFAKTHLHRLNNVVVPADNDGAYMDLYRQLRNKMFQIEKYLLESRFIEETILIPKIQLAQKAINIKSSF